MQTQRAAPVPAWWFASKRLSGSGGFAAGGERPTRSRAADDTGPRSDTNPQAARLRPVRLLVPLLLILHLDRHELVVVGLPLVNRLQVSSKR
jgi:hypothetical protein